MIRNGPTRIGASRYEGSNVLDRCDAVADEHSNVICAAKESES